MNQHWITPDSDRPLNQATLHQVVRSTAAARRSRPDPICDQCFLRPEMRRGYQNPQFDVTPADFDLAEGLRRP